MSAICTIIQTYVQNICLTFSTYVFVHMCHIYFCTYVKHILKNISVLGILTYVYNFEHMMDVSFTQSQKHMFYRLYLGIFTYVQDNISMCTNVQNHFYQRTYVRHMFNMYSSLHKIMAGSNTKLPSNFCIESNPARNHVLANLCRGSSSPFRIE